MVANGVCRMSVFIATKSEAKVCFFGAPSTIEKYPPTLQTPPRTCPPGLVLRAVGKVTTLCLVVTFLGYTRNGAGRVYHSSLPKFSIALGEKSPPNLPPFCIRNPRDDHPKNKKTHNLGHTHPKTKPSAHLTNN